MSNGGLHVNTNCTSSLSPLAGELSYYREFPSSEKKVELAFMNAELDEGEPKPSDRAIKQISALVEVVSKTMPLSQATVSVFYGDAIVTWKHGPRELSVISRGDASGPKILRFVTGQGQEANQGIAAPATAEDFRQAVRWLYS